MKTIFKHIFSLVATAAFLLFACTPNMDTPDPGTPPDPPLPGAPPQVIYLPQGVEVNNLAVSGNYLYATAPAKDQVYRINISDMGSLSLTANAVPYVTVPGASGITADDRGGLYIGSSGAPGNGNRPSHKWTNDQVIYFAHTGESWNSRFRSNPAQKLFVAPRGSFDALAWYKDPLATTNNRYEGGLYYAGTHNLEGMGISNDRYTNSLDAVKNLIPEELDFLVQLALGGLNFDDLDLDKIFSVADLFKLKINLNNALNEDKSINYVNLAVNNLNEFVGLDFGGAPFGFPSILPIFTIPGSLLLNPRWGLNLVTLWGLELLIPYSMIGDEIAGFLFGALGGDWWQQILNLGLNDFLSGFLSTYRYSGSGTNTILSFNGAYKDQPAVLPQRPYVLGYPISLNFDKEIENASNIKLGLTLHLLQFQDGNGGSFSLIEDRAQLDRFVDAVSNGDMLDKIKNVVNVLNLQRLIDNGNIQNEQLVAYIQFLMKIAENSEFDLMATLDDFAELMMAFGITIDFRSLLEAWWDLPDWLPLNGTKAGQIIDHDMLGSIYQAIDGFTEGLTGLWETLAGWVTSKIPRVNSAQGWWYQSPNSPTGIAFGRDAGAGGITGWVVDNGMLYSRRIDMNAYQGSYEIDRDDYPYSVANPRPLSPWRMVNNRWFLTVSSSGQNPTIVPRSTLLNNCNGIIYDAANQRVLVSSDDGAGLSGKGRIVSVRYNGWTEPLPTKYPDFTPPSPRIPIVGLTSQLVNASYEVRGFTPLDGTLNHPKGMALKDNHLFVADGNRIVVYYVGPTR